MKNALIAFVVVAGLAASSATAGSLSDPIVTPEPAMSSDVIATDTAASSGDVDGLIFAIWSMLVVATVGGAF